MLYPINPLETHYQNDLLGLAQWQRRMLVYLRSVAVFDMTTLRSNLGADFADWLNSSLLTTNKKQKRAFNRFKQAMEQYARRDGGEKQTVIDDFDHDQTFAANLNNSRFIFAFSPDLSQTHELAKTLLNAFYEFLTWEIPGVLLPSGANLHRQHLVENYIAQNPLLRSICPCCDNRWPEPQQSRGTSQTLEHFFHKEEHATICLHPSNLIPICYICNGRRDNKEALAPSATTTLTIDEIFYPLERAAIDYAELKLRGPLLHEPAQFIFENSAARTDDWSNAIAAYEDLYEIPSRWKARWTHIIPVATRAVQYALRSQATPIDARAFNQLVTDVIRDMEHDDTYYRYPARRWLMWARDTHPNALFADMVDRVTRMP